MKIYRFISVAVVAIVAMAVAVGCNDADKVFDESDNSIDPDDSIESSGSGYISFSDFSLSVDVEEELFSRSTRSEETSEEVIEDEMSDEAAADEAIDASDYFVIISSRSTGEVVYESSYAETIEHTEAMALPSGSYSFFVTSHKDAPATMWGERVYSSDEKSLTVGDDNTTYIGAVVCRLSTIKCQVSISADMLALFSTEDEENPFLVTLEYGDEELVFTTDKLCWDDATQEEQDAASGYFAPQDGESEIEVTITGLYNTSPATEEPSYTAITWSQSISEVAAGQSRMISVKIDNFEDGVIGISFEVQEWVYDEPLGVDIFTPSFALSLFETEIFEPEDDSANEGAAVLARLDGEDVETPYLITEEMFNELFGTYSPQYGVVITPESGVSVESVKVSVESSCVAFMEAVDAVGELYLWQSGASVSGFGDYVNLVESGSTGALSIALKYSAMHSLYDFVGEHEFTVVVVDSEGRTSSTTLYFESCSDVVVEYPTISWDGGDFSLTHTISTVEAENPTIKFSISSPNGVKSMSISINSDVLTQTELEQLGLSQDMDLANPATDDMAGMLSELGFPVGDEVVGETYLEFDITSFMPLLAQVHAGSRPDLEAAYTDFVITVVDESGGESSETLKVVSYYTE